MVMKPQMWVFVGFVIKTSATCVRKRDKYEGRCNCAWKRTWTLWEQISFNWHHVEMKLPQACSQSFDFAKEHLRSKVENNKSNFGNLLKFTWHYELWDARKKANKLISLRRCSVLTNKVSHEKKVMKKSCGNFLLSDCFMFFCTG